MLNKKIRAGMTLIELLVVIAIVAISLGVGVPAFQGFFQSQRFTIIANDLLASVNLTRAEAIQRGTRVDLAPAGDGTDWSKGWVIFIDQNNNQLADEGEQIVYSHGPVPKGFSVSGNMPSGNSVQKYVSYTGTGRTRNNNGGFALGGTFLIMKEGDDQPHRKVVINELGRPMVCNVDIDDC